jgi:hypothetical protein
VKEEEVVKLQPTPTQSDLNLLWALVSPSSCRRHLQSPFSPSSAALFIVHLYHSKFAQISALD